MVLEKEVQEHFSQLEDSTLPSAPDEIASLSEGKALFDA